MSMKLGPPRDDGEYWHIHKKTDDDNKVTWAHNYSRFVSFSMVASEVNAESVCVCSAVIVLL
jgi:hypothetical protein